MNSNFPLALLTALLITPQVHAQTPPPDAGALRQHIERQPLDKPPPQDGPPLHTEQSTALHLPGGMSFTVRSFRFASNTLLANETLQAVVQPWLNRPVDFAELQRATAAVADAYRAAGWIASAFLPNQDITEGDVTIQITESQFSGVRIEGAETSRLKSATALAHVRQRNGQPLSAPALDRSLLLIDDLPGSSVSGALSPGVRPGETELLLRLNDDRLIDGVVRLDRGGARFTGEERALLTLGVNSPLRIGDRARVDLLHSEGSDYARLGYSLPVGDYGWQVGVNGSYFEYELVDGSFAALDGEGSSSSLGADASYPLVRSRLRNLYLTVALDERNFRNAALDVRQSDYSVSAMTLGLTGNLYDNFGGGGANSFNLSWVTGELRQHQPDIGENPELDGDYNKLLYGVSRQQVVTSTLSLYGAINGQFTQDRLDSAEQYYLGGPDGVRAYPVNDGGGSRAVLATVELRWLFHPAFTAAVFDDWGHVTNPGDESGYTLRGQGVSLEWRAPWGIQLEASFASRAGRNPNATSSGAYQDGSRNRDRWWLQASAYF